MSIDPTHNHDAQPPQTAAPIVDAQVLDSIAAQSRRFRALEIGELPIDERRYEKGELVFRQGEKADYLYLILEGSVSIHQESGGEEVQLSTLEAGQCFGELGLKEQVPRLAAARAAQDCRLMRVPASNYQAKLAQSPELVELFGTLKRIYKLPRRGRLIQSTGTFLGREAVTNIYELAGGKKVVVSRVIGAELYNADEVLAPGEKIEKTLRFVNDAQRRELRIGSGDRLIGLTVQGHWSLLAELQLLLLEGGPLRPEVYVRFESTGRLKYEETLGTNSLLCLCTHTESRIVKRAIRGGCASLAGVQDQLGCGSVCGACVPMIKHLLGNEQWTPVRIIDELHLTSEIRRLRLRPVGRPIAASVPGQHIVLSGLVAGNWVQRAYTLTSPSDEAEHYEIMVKREKAGVFSRWLFAEAGDDAFLRVSPPQGEFTWQPTGQPVVCLVAGIGVTPSFSILRNRLKKQVSDPLHIDYSARTEQELVGADELKAAAQADPGVTISLRVTTTGGRIERAHIKALHARFPGADYYLCGPRAYMDAVTALLRKVGVRAAQIKIENFSSPNERPSAGRDAQPVQAAGPGGKASRSLLGYIAGLFGK